MNPKTTSNHTPLIARLVAPLVGGLLLSSSASAADFSWNNSGTNLLWNNSANWLEGGSATTNTPGSSDNIVTPTLFGTIALNISSATVADWTYNSTSTQTVTKTVGSGALTIAGDLNKSGSGSLVLRSSATNQLDLSIGQILLSGTGNLNIGHDSGTSLLTTLTAGSATISGGNLNFLVGGPSYAITGALTMSGTGTLNLAGHGVGGVVAVTRVNVGALSSASATNVIQANANSAANANDTGTLVLNNNAGTATYAGIIRPGGAAGNTNVVNVEKNGAGTQIFSGNSNTYNGTTIVNGGTLLINNASGSGTGTSVITINDGGAFGGTGTSSGAITVNAGGAITPGNAGAGTFTGGSSLTWNSDNSLAGMTFDLGATQLASDQLALTGAFTKGTGSTFVFSFTDVGYQSSFAYTLVTFASTTFTAGDFSATGIAGDFAIVGNELQFTAATIPEPSSYALLAGVFATAAVGLRRRRSLG